MPYALPKIYFLIYFIKYKVRIQIKAKKENGWGKQK